MPLFSTPLFTSTLPRVFDATHVNFAASPTLSGAMPLPGVGHTAPVADPSGGIAAHLRDDLGQAPSPGGTLSATPHG
ncbi:MAG: hypothetical protein ACU0CI_06640 [Shimia sp.]